MSAYRWVIASVLLLSIIAKLTRIHTPRMSSPISDALDAVLDTALLAWTLVLFW